MTAPAISPLELRAVAGLCSDGSGVQGISVAFSPGRLHVLRGTADSGTTALFRFAGLLERPGEGDVSIFGLGTRELSEDLRAELRTQRLGFAFSSPFLLSSFNVIENVAMPLFKISHVTPDEARRRTEAMLEFVGLGGAAEVAVEDLELPAQYRVAVARGLVNEPVALLVENLDGTLHGAALDDLAALLREAALNFGTTIIATSSPHWKQLAADRVLDLSDGRIARDSEFLPETCG